MEKRQEVAFSDALIHWQSVTFTHYRTSHTRSHDPDPFT